MTRTITDYTDIPTAGTQIQLGAAIAGSLLKRKISAINMRADPGNTGNAAVGDSGVSLTNGYILKPGEALSVDYGDGSEELGYWWGDVATSGDNIVWVAVGKL